MLERDLYELVYNYLELVFRDRLKPARGDLRRSPPDRTKLATRIGELRR